MPRPKLTPEQVELRKEQKKEYQRAYYEANKDKFVAYRKKVAAKNKEIRAQHPVALNVCPCPICSSKR